MSSLSPYISLGFNATNLVKFVTSSLKTNLGTTTNGKTIETYQQSLKL